MTHNNQQFDISSQRTIGTALIVVGGLLILGGIGLCVGACIKGAAVKRDLANVRLKDPLGHRGALFEPC